MTEIVKAAKPATKDATLSLLGGLLTLNVDVLPAKIAEERVTLTYIIPDIDEPTRPEQMYVDPADPARQWKPGQLDKARDVDGILYRVDPDEVAEAKTPLLPTGQIDVTSFPAEQVEKVCRPSGALYRLRPKAAPHVYAMLVDLLADRTVAFVAELTIRGNQRMYRVESWNGALILQEQVRPGEFYAAEDYSKEYPEALLDKMQTAVSTTVEDFDPDTYRSFLRDRAAELDAAKRDPNAAPVVKVAPRPKVDDAEALMALLDGVAAASKAKPKAKARKAS